MSASGRGPSRSHRAKDFRFAGQVGVTTAAMSGTFICSCTEPIGSRRFAAGSRRAVPSASIPAGIRGGGHGGREHSDVREEGADHLLDFGAVAAVRKMRSSFHDVEQGAGNRRGDLAGHLRRGIVVLGPGDDERRTADSRAVGEPVRPRVGSAGDQVGAAATITLTVVQKPVSAHGRKWEKNLQTCLLSQSHQSARPTCLYR